MRRADRGVPVDACDVVGGGSAGQARRGAGFTEICGLGSGKPSSIVLSQSRPHWHLYRSAKNCLRRCNDQRIQTLPNTPAGIGPATHGLGNSTAVADAKEVF